MPNCSRKQRLVLALLFVLSGCASEIQHKAPNGNLLEFVAKHSPPLVLRVPLGDPIGAETPSAMAEVGIGLLGGIGGFLYTLPYTFGLGIVLVPFGIAHGAMSASEVASCTDQWGGAIENVSQWLRNNSTFLEGEVRSQLVDRGQNSVILTTIPITHQTGKIGKNDHEIFREISERTNSPVLLIGTLKIVFIAERGDIMGPVKCGVKLEADVSIEARNVTIGADQEIIGPISFSEARIADDPEFIQRAAKDPELGPMLLRRVLDDLASHIAELYPKRVAVVPVPDQK